MRVLHLLQSSMISGAENVAADICMMFEGSCEMMYCSPDGSIRQSLVDRGVNFFPLHKLNMAEVRRAINTYKPDIIHAHDIRATVYAACVSGEIPIISHLHGNAEDMRICGMKPLLSMLSTKKVKKS